MADFEVICPYCNQSLDCPEELVGKFAECPACNQTIDISNRRSFVEHEVPPRLFDLQAPVGFKKTGGNCKTTQCGISNNTLFKWVFISLGVLIGLFIILVVIAVHVESVRNLSTLKQSNNLCENAENSIANGDINTADALLAESCKLRHIGQADGNGKPNRLQTQLQILKKEASNHEKLLSLTEEEYNALKKGQLTKIFVENERINKLLISDMYNNRDIRPQLLANRQAEKEERLRQMTIADEKRDKELDEQDAALRIKFSREIRDNFLDNGLNVIVEVDGTNNTRLILRYVLFNEVWMRKFKTSGLLDRWHCMGFTRIELYGHDYRQISSME